MSAWRQVQETLYQRFADAWLNDDVPTPGALTPYAFGNEEFDPPQGQWAMVRVIRLPGGAGTMGRPGNRKMDRVGLLIIDLREPPGNGVGSLSDLAERAAAIFENCRIIAPYDIRFGPVEPGEESDIDKGRWWGVSVEGRFDYEELR
jgi:hypothetical protein